MTGNNVPSFEERERARRCLKLRNEGHTWAEIAEAEGYTDESGARHAAGRLVDKMEVADVAEHRALEGARLDELHKAHWPAALKGDIKAAELILKILDRRARLFGLNMPEKFVVSANTVGSDEDFADVVANLVRDIAQAEAPLPEPVDREPWVD
ncbi:MAG: hypothetical protein ACJA07_004486 [Rhodococcus sp. (in: high G+C Gram-positive bacteria)]|jgi:hypothetical protein